MHDVRQLKVLTGFRFFAALHVVCFHNFYLFGNLQSLPPFFLKFIQTGEAAVSFFFILSGFILTHVYQHKLVTADQKTNYFISRLAKLYPLYFLGMLLDFPRVINYFFATNEPGIAVLKASVSGTAYFLMLQSWFPPVTTAWNPPAWSLSCEMFFYIAFLFLLKPILKFKNNLQAILVSYLIPLILFAILSQVFDTESPTFTLGWIAFPLIRIFEFFIGIFLYGFVGNQNPMSQWIQKHSSLVFWSALAVSLSLTQFFENPIDGKIFSHLLLVPLFSLIILSASYDDVACKRVFTHPVVNYLGMASYAIYILHQPLKNYCLPFMEPSLFLGSIYFGTLLVLCCLAHQFVEIPLQQKIGKRLRVLLRSSASLPNSH